MTLKSQSELETQLDLAKSNLQLVLSNNEMLEEALKRETACNPRDVGWRRWSGREVQNTQRPQEDRVKSLDYGPLNEAGRPPMPSSVTTVAVNDSHQGGIQAQQLQTPVISQESRFFKFRLGGGAACPLLSSRGYDTIHRFQASCRPTARFASYFPFPAVVDIGHT